MTPAPRCGVLFDLDNTLTHRGLSIAAYARHLGAHYASQLADASSEVIAALIAERDNGGYGVPGSRFATVREDVAHTLRTRLRWHAAPSAHDLAAHWFAHFPTSSVEMPGASALMDRLAAEGVPMGIVSNGMDASRRALARHLGFESRMRTLVSSERAGVRKPEGRIFELAARELGMPAQRCWFIGDHPVNDVAGARAAGMRPVWLAGFHAPSADVHTETTTTALAELEALLLR